MTSTSVTKTRTAATMNGNSSVAQRPITAVSLKSPAIRGPATSPSAEAATTLPIFRVRSSSFRLISISAAWAIGWLPAVKPEMALPTSKRM